MYLGDMSSELGINAMASLAYKLLCTRWAGALGQAGQRAGGKAGLQAQAVGHTMNLCVCKWPSCFTAGLSVPAAASCWLLPLCRKALRDGTSPDLSAALAGVSQTKLFLGGEVVPSGLTAQEMFKRAALAHMTLVLPTGQGQGLGIAGPVERSMLL